MQISKCVSLTKNFGWTYRHCVRCFSFGTDESEKYRPAAGRKRYGLLSYTSSNQGIESNTFSD